MERNLAALSAAMPGAGGACAWTAGGDRHELPALADGTPPAALPPGTTAVGAAWPIPHVADAVTLHFAGPSPADFTLEVFDGRRWVVYDEGGQVAVEGNRAVLSFAPVAARMLRVPLPDGAVVARLEVHRYLAEEGWPSRITGGELARDILARDEEPSFEALSLIGLSMPSWAMLGLKDNGHEQAVWWDGQLHCHGRRISLALGEPTVRPADVRDTIRRELLDGWMPAVIVRARIGQVTVTQTAFTAFADGPRGEKPATFLRVELTNLGADAFTGPLRVEVRDAPPDPFAGTLGVEIFNPPSDDDPSTWECAGGVLLRNGRPFLATAHPCRHDAPATLCFDVALPPAETAIFAFALPCPPWQPAVDDAAALARVPFARALEHFRAYWEELLAPAMTLDLPEGRLNHLYRGVLAQLFINAYGDIMPYGAAPSNYDGSVYGVEEGWAMLALAMSGFTDDAQRYMDATYLQERFLTKAATFIRAEDRNQQNHNGLKPSGAIELFRLSGDRAWIAKYRALIAACAEWTIASRRQTMVLENGEKPLHYGLLPRWAYGGDIHDQCHPLYPNFTCWRALRDTAWLAEQFGDVERAARYRREAAEYRETLLAAVDALYRREADPPYLPLRTDARAPDSGDFYQLFAGLLEELLPFAYDDPRANYLGDFLEADNRTFCLLPRFRSRDVAGGIDALYGMGHILSRLHQNRIREFLLGFYAYQVFNMEHACFTSREQNRVYAADRHLRESVPVQDWSDPLPCASAVGVLLLRHLLVTEESRGAAEYTGRLLLLYGAPRRWYEGGNHIAVTGVVTHAGKVSYTVDVSPDLRRIRAEVTLPRDTCCTGVVLRLRHPRGAAMRAVTVDGAPAAFHAREEVVEIPAPGGTHRIEAIF